MEPLFLRRVLALAVLFLAAAGVSRAQSEWPKSIITAGGTVINLYQPQVLSYAGTSLKSRSVISVIESDDEDPLFGVAWTTATVGVDTLSTDSLGLEIRFPGSQEYPDGRRYLQRRLYHQLCLQFGTYE
jgi:hypothetical protein